MKKKVNNQKKNSKYSTRQANAIIIPILPIALLKNVNCHSLTFCSVARYLLPLSISPLKRWERQDQVCFYFQLAGINLFILSNLNSEAMKLTFCKYQGTGNDFILIDNRAGHFNYSKELVVKLCNRRFGIGADGLLLLENVEGYDFRMVYYNSDGSPATMCGNGGRCISAFANHLGVISATTKFLAADGPHFASIQNINELVAIVEITLKDVTSIQKNKHFVILNTGTLHFVSFVDNPDIMDIVEEGSKIRYSPEFAPAGINVNFVKLDGDHIYVRTYEKGVENETLSCGTGVTAAAIAASEFSNGENFKVTTKGGQLSVAFEKEGNKYTNIRLSGPATFVYSGEISI
jgi:diaminopimelate epimerase